MRGGAVDKIIDMVNFVLEICSDTDDNECA